MFKLGSVGTLDIAERRIVLDEAGLHQVVQLHMLAMSKASGGDSLPRDTSPVPIGRGSDGTRVEFQSSYGSCSAGSWPRRVEGAQSVRWAPARSERFPSVSSVYSITQSRRLHRLARSLCRCYRKSQWQRPRPPPSWSDLRP